MAFHISSKGQTIGPFTSEQVSDLLSQGEINDTDFIWSNEMEDWTPISQNLCAKLGIVNITGKSNPAKTPYNYWAAIELGWWDKLLDEIKKTDCLEDLGDLTFLNSLKNKAQLLFEKSTNNEVQQSPAEFLIQEYNLLDKSAEKCEADIIALISSFLENKELQDFLTTNRRPTDSEFCLIPLQHDIAQRIKEFRTENANKLSSDEIMNVWNLAGDNFGESEDLPLILDLNSELHNLESLGGCFAHMKSVKLSKLEAFFLDIGMFLDWDLGDEEKYGRLTRMVKTLALWGIPHKWISKLIEPFEEEIEKLTHFELPFESSDLQTLEIILSQSNLTNLGMLPSLVVPDLSSKEAISLKNKVLVQKKTGPELRPCWVLYNQKEYVEFGENINQIKNLESTLIKAQNRLNELLFRKASADEAYENKLDENVKAFEEKINSLSRYINLSKKLDLICVKARERNSKIIYGKIAVWLLAAIAFSLFATCCNFVL